MSSEQFDLFLILLRLKSYLVSLIDHPAAAEDYSFTEEFLERKYPDRKEEIIELLVNYDIHSDAEIAFNEKIHYKFRDMVRGRENASRLTNILEKFHIDSIENTVREKAFEELKLAREQKLKEIVSVLLQLARVWTQRSGLEENVDNFLLLEEEDVIRPEEEKELGKLDSDTMISYKTISKLTELYLEQLIEYYFRFGGDVELSGFIKELDEFKEIVKAKYNELFKKSGLDPQKI